jgi:Zn-dependent M28 family amino/carboxypeptidase
LVHARPEVRPRKARPNADGISALLEAARVLSTRDFERSIYFLAFDLEEVGLVGSTAWARDHRNDRILSML